MLLRSDDEGIVARLDAQSRQHLGLIVRQTLLLAAICVPFALAGGDPLTQYLQMLRAAFGFSTLVMIVVAALSGANLSASSLCIWDHVAALLLIKLACTLALHGLS